LNERSLIYMGVFTGSIDRAMPRFFFAFGVAVGFSDYTYGVNSFLNYPNNEIW